MQSERCMCVYVAILASVPLRLFRFTIFTQCDMQKSGTTKLFMHMSFFSFENWKMGTFEGFRHEKNIVKYEF